MAGMNESINQSMKSHSVKISSKSEMVELEAFVNLRRNDPGHISVSNILNCLDALMVVGWPIG